MNIEEYFDKKSGILYIDRIQSISKKYIGYFLKHNICKKIVLTSLNINSSNIKYIAQSLFYSSDVYKLDLGMNRIGDNKYITYLLKWNPQITKLNLEHNYIHIHKWPLDLLKYNSRLIKLNLDNNNIGAIEADILGKLLIESKNLQILSLGYNNLVHHLRYITDGLKYNDSLLELNLSKNNLNTQWTISLADALKLNRTLKVLNLSNNNLCNRSSVNYPISNILKNNNSIETLYLSNCTIRGLELNLIANALSHNHSLKYLSLCRNSIYNYINPPTINFGLLTPTNILEVIDLRNNNISTAHFSSIFIGLTGNRSLYKLYIDHHYKKNGLYHEIKKLLNRNKNLKKLMLHSANKLKQIGKQKFAKTVLPRYVYRDCFKPYHLLSKA